MPAGVLSARLTGLFPFRVAWQALWDVPLANQPDGPTTPFMLLRLRNAAASMTEMTRQQERVANNLANANTVGYKRDRLFTQALEERLDAEGAPRSDRRVTQGADPRQGTLKATGNPLDVALGGEGFFVTTDAATGAPRYTRAGQFALGEDGTLRTPAGHAVEGQGGPIQIPPESGPVQIAKDGTIQAGGQRVGALSVVRFENPLELERLDGAAFAAGNAAPEPVQAPDVIQGHLEGSNVNPVAEMADMIEHFRTFESQQKVLQTTDQVLGRVTRDLGTF